MTSEGLSVEDALGGWAVLRVPEEPSVAPVLDVGIWPVMPKGPSVAAELDGWVWSVVPE